MHHDGLKFRPIQWAVITTALSCGLYAAEGAQAVTYIEGNLDGVERNSGMTVDISDAKVMTLKGETLSAEISYDAIAKVQIGETIVGETYNEPLYKVWTLHKRLLSSMAEDNKLQQLIFTWKEGKNEERSMTVEMGKRDADQLVKELDARLAASDKARQAKTWWGDGYWKTNSNQDKWGGAGAVASRE